MEEDMVELIILASRGRIRRLRLKENLDDPVAKPHLIEDQEGVVDLRVDKRGEVVTDQSGRFSRSAGQGQEGGMSVGEGHNLNRELERQAVKRVAEIIAKFVSDAGYPPWRLVAPSPILNSLLDNL